jgi:hypothetical protein
MENEGAKVNRWIGGGVGGVRAATAKPPAFPLVTRLCFLLFLPFRLRLAV